MGVDGLVGGGVPGLRQPRLAEMIAAILRDRMLSGEIEDGGELPKQELLLEEFQVSVPSLREALRILETEGLITVRRGNRGGAVVHLPKVHSAAYMLGLVLQTRDVGLVDLGEALRHLEPVCAALCCELEDRGETIVPRLWEIHERTVAAVDDELEFVRFSRQFHDALVDGCGNETMIVLVGTLERLWSAQEQAWAERASQEGLFPGKQVRTSGLRAHEKLIGLIEAGDVDRVSRFARKHLESTQYYALEANQDAQVKASPLRTSA